MALQSPSPGCGAVWLARLTGGQEVGGSNPLSPTERNPCNCRGFVRFSVVRLGATSLAVADTKEDAAPWGRTRSDLRRGRFRMGAVRPAGKLVGKGRCRRRYQPKANWSERVRRHKANSAGERFVVTKWMRFLTIALGLSAVDIARHTAWRLK